MLLTTDWSCNQLSTLLAMKSEILKRGEVVMSIEIDHNPPDATFPFRNDATLRLVTARPVAINGLAWFFRVPEVLHATYGSC